MCQFSKASECEQIDAKFRGIFFEFRTVVHKKPVARVFFQNTAILQKTLEQFRLMHGKRVKFFCDFPFSASPAMLQKQGGKEQRIIRDETGCPYSAVFKSAGGKHSMFINVCSQQVDTAFDKVEVPVDHGIHFRLKVKIPEP